MSNFLPTNLPISLPHFPEFTFLPQLGGGSPSISLTSHRSAGGYAPDTWQHTVDELTSKASIVALTGFVPVVFRRFAPLVLPPQYSAIITAVSLVGMVAGAVSMGGNTALYGDKMLNGETTWQNTTHTAASALGFASIAAGGMCLMWRVTPPPALALLTIASVISDVVELGAFYTEMQSGTNGKAPKSTLEFVIQAGLVLGLNLSNSNRYEIRKGLRYLFDKPAVTLTSDDPVQQAVYDVGQELLAHCRQYRPTLQERIVNYTVELSLRDPKLRSNLLRFTAALPGIQDNPATVMRFAREFFLPVVDQFPAYLRPALRLGLSEKLALDIVEKFIAKAIELPPNIMGTNFLGGVNTEQLLKIISRLKKGNVDVTVDNLGEFITSEVAAEEYFTKCLRMTKALERGSSASYKLTGLTPHFDPYAPHTVMDTGNTLTRRLDTLLDEAQSKDLIAFVDAEHQVTNPLLYQFQRAALDRRPDYRKGGFVLQTYGTRSLDYLEEIGTWAMARGQKITGDNKTNCYVRLVKGAYLEGEIIEAQKNGWPIPVYMRQEETDSNYRRCIDKLFSMHEYINPCVAGHNERDISYAIAKAKEMGILDKIEIQCLFGMSDNLKYALAKMGVRVRAYVPHITQKADTPEVFEDMSAVDQMRKSMADFIYDKLPFIPRTPGPIDGDPAAGIGYLGRRLIENGSVASRKRVTWDSDDKSILTLNTVSLKPQDLSGIDAMPEAYRTRIALTGYKPAPYLNPSEPGRLNTYQRAVAVVRNDIATNWQSRVHEVAGLPYDADARVFDITDPSTGEVITRVRNMGMPALDQILGQAQQAQFTWGKAMPGVRKDVLLKVHSELSAMRDRLSAIMQHESAKQVKQADADVKEMLDAIAYAAYDIDRKITEGVFDRYDPVGVAAIISPWNFPAAIPAIHKANALAGGSAVVYKPSELAPRIAIEAVNVWRRVLKEYGFNPNVVQLLLTDEIAMSKALVKDPHVGAVNFTGSKNVGLDVVENAGLRQAIIETGGTNAYVVGTGADADVAVGRIQYGAFGYAGQKCSHIQNVFVPRSKMESYIARLKAMAQSTFVGSAHEPESLVTPLVHPRTRTHLDSILGELQPDQIIVDGRNHPNANGRLVGPTIVREAKRLLNEEFFGPMINVIPYDEPADVFKAVRQSQLGLTFAVDTPSPVERALFVKTDLETDTGALAGNIYADMPPVGAEIGVNPFGSPGSNLSGTGTKTGGVESLMYYLKPKAGVVDKSPLPSKQDFDVLASRKPNDFRQVAPTDVQYPGRTDVIESVPMGPGVIIADETMDSDTLRRLLYMYTSTGNQVRVVGVGQGRTAVHSVLQGGYTGSLLSDGATGMIQYKYVANIDHIELSDKERWVHALPGANLGEELVAGLRSQARALHTGFFTRLNVFAPNLSDPHLTAQTQYHRALSINTAASGDIEKVEI